MFESEGFVGKAAIWIRNLPSSPPGLFEGQRRKSRIVMQVRRSVPACPCALGLLE